MNNRLQLADSAVFIDCHTTELAEPGGALSDTSFLFKKEKTLNNPKESAANKNNVRQQRGTTEW